MTRHHDIIEVEGQVHHETEKAYLFSTDGEKKVWLAKSMCEWNGESIMELPEWVAVEKGLV